MEKKIYQKPESEVHVFNTHGDLLDWEPSINEGGPGIMEGKQDLWGDCDDELDLQKFSLWD